MALKERDHEGLGEHRGARRLDHPEASSGLARAGGTELDTNHLALSANVVDEVVFVSESTELGLPEITHRGRVSDDAFVVEDLQCRKSGDHGQLVTLERGRVHHGAVH